MGNRGSLRRPVIPSWSVNASMLLAHKLKDGGETYVSCTTCKLWQPVDLARLIIERGALVSLWNRRPTCTGCGNRLTFMATWAPGHRVIPLITDDPHQTDDLHRAWLREFRRMKGFRD